MREYQYLCDSVTDREDFTSYDSATDDYIGALLDEIKERDEKIAELTAQIRQFMGDLA